MAHLKDSIVNGALRVIGKLYASEFVGKLTGNADSATKATQDANGKVIADTYATKSELAGKANSSHGNHVPATETANNAKFLRNDNTWQTVTPANIGAATSGHTHSSYVNQNAFSNVKVGDTTIAADTTTDTLTLVGSNVTLTPDTTNDKVTIGITKSNVTAALGYTPPTTDTKYTHPTTSGNKHIPSGGSSGQILRWSADGTAVWGNDNNTTYGVATSSALGLVKSGTDITVDSSGNVSVNDSSHNHNASNINAGTLSSDRLPTVPVAKGGTGATTAAAAKTNLGFLTSSDFTVANGVLTLNFL